MKVLFAVSNEEVSENIVKKYQRQYKEIISYKNVYYFNAILKELQKDKSYDRIVISEDLETFTHNQYDQIDKFIFDKLDSISDEASNFKGDDIPIILICSDRRTKSEQMLVKLFSIGIYNALLGSDRSIDELCKLIKKPRQKKEAKAYYKIDTEGVKYQSENENDVSEIEIQNILAHYTRLGKNEDKYVESFENIATQYNDVQLRIICKFLPLNVRAVLEERSPKYQQVMAFQSKVTDKLRTSKDKLQNIPGTTEKLLRTVENKESILSKPVVIPSAVNIEKGKKLSKPKAVSEENSIEDTVKLLEQEISNYVENNEINEETENVEVEETVKRRRGRPKKNIETNLEEQPKKKRGRPRKNNVAEEQISIQEEYDEDTINNSKDNDEDEFFMPGFEDVAEQQKPEDIEILGFDDEEEQEELSMPGFDDEEEQEDLSMPGFDDEEEQEDLSMLGFDDEEEQEELSMPGFDDEEEQEELSMPGFDDETTQTESRALFTEETTNKYNNNEEKPTKFVTSITKMQPRAQQEPKIQERNIDISSLLNRNQKIACFVGTSKNGTSFVVNNVAQVLANSGISVAILDATQNRNAYYIYTKNDEQLRNVAMSCLEGLVKGTARGVNAETNLDVYSALPDDNEYITRAGEILQTLVAKYDVILIDCDFETPASYFSYAKEVYLVQSYDVLTIQPLTAFLRELKAKNILDENKLRIILNKTEKLRGISEKTIIGGMSSYNEPSMSYMVDLFDKQLIKYIAIPFDEEVYVRYLEGLINCEISLKGYPKNIIQILNEIANMIYPIENNINKKTGKTGYRPPTINKNVGTGFTPQMNSTLEQMRKY